MAYATFDESLFPIILITFSEADPSKDAFEEYLAQLLALYDRKQTVSFVFDASKSRILSADRRTDQANWLKKNAEVIGKYQKCAVFVLPNLIVRLLFDAILAINGFPSPFAVVKSVEEGIKTAQEKLGLDITNKG